MYNFLTEFTYTNGSAFPGTAAVNASGSGTADGTEFKKKFVDDLWGSFQAFLYNTGQTPSDVAESYTASQVVDAVRLFAGVYEYESGMTLKAGTRVMSPIPGDYMFYHVVADATAADTADAIADFKTDLAAGRFQYHAPRFDKRQVAVQGSVNSSGLANFLNISGTGIQIDATPIPVVLTCASGYGPGGHPIDRPIVFTADEAPAAWDGLANDTHYLYVDYNDGGAPVFSSTTLRPVYRYALPATPATGQHCYLISEAKMYAYDGASWNHVERMFIGETEFSGGSPTSVTTYALNGRASISGEVDERNNNTWPHNVGVAIHEGLNLQWIFAPTSDFDADSNYAHNIWSESSVGHVIGHYGRENKVYNDTHKNLSFGFRQFVQFYKDTGSYHASGYYKINIERSF